MSIHERTGNGHGTATKSRIMIVEDHPIMRQGIVDMISREGDLEIVAEAATTLEAKRKVEAARPDLALIDITLGDESGLDLIKDLKNSHPEIGMLVLSMHEDSLYAERVVRAGALGYVNKSRPGEELIASIRKALSGDTVLSESMSDLLIHRAVHGRPPGVGVDSLSDRELQVFELIGRGLTMKEIAHQLCISVKTVETHRQHVKEKLGADTSADLVRRAALWVDSGGRKQDV